jgi:cell division inhibitor SepF
MKALWQRTLNYFGLGDDEEEAFENEFEDLDDDTQYRRETSTVRKIDRTPDINRAKRATSLRSVGAAPNSRVHIIEPKSFNDAQLVADKFKAKIPVIVNLQDTDVDLSKRLIDFGSGLTYALDGGMQRVAEKVFLLTPSNVVVSAEEKRRLRERGFFNQF